MIRTHGKWKWTCGPGRAQSGWYSGKDSHTAAGPARRSTSVQRDGVSNAACCCWCCWGVDRLGGVCAQDAMANGAARVPSGSVESEAAQDAARERLG